MIARFCHPSALQIIQQWIARLKKRWDEVTVSNIIYDKFVRRRVEVNGILEKIKTLPHDSCFYELLREREKFCGKFPQLLSDDSTSVSVTL